MAEVFDKPTDDKSPLLNSSTVSSELRSDSTSTPKNSVSNHPPNADSDPSSPLLASNGRDPQFRSRWTSLSVAYLVNFLLVTQNFLYYSSLWPYLSTIDPGVTEEFFGLAVTFTNLASALASPVFGYWSNRIQQTRRPIVLGITGTIIGSLILALAESFPVSSRKWVVLVARTISGLGYGNSGALHAYVAMASTERERGKAMAFRSASSSLGMAIGPAIQTFFVPFGYPGIVIGEFRWNMFTASAYANVAIGLIQIALMYGFFKEYWVSVHKSEIKPIGNELAVSQRARESTENGVSVLNTKLLCSQSDVDSDEFQNALTPKDSVCNEISLEGHRAKSNSERTIHKPDETPLKPYDLTAMCTLIYIRFMFWFCYTYDLTIGSPFTMTMFGWTTAEAVTYNGYIACGSGILEIFQSIFSGTLLIRIFKEKVMILMGIFCFLSFYLLTFSWPGLPPLVPLSVNHSADLVINNQMINLTVNSPSTVELVGRSALNAFGGRHLASNDASNVSIASNASSYGSDQMATSCVYSWCTYTSRIYLAQYIVAYWLMTCALALGYLSNATLFSKVLGPRKQGLYQGIFAGSGQAGMTFSPLICSSLFRYEGPRVAWAFGSGILVTGAFLVVLFWKRLVPWSAENGDVVDKNDQNV